MIVGHIGGGSVGGYQVQRSVRLRSAASAYFSRTPSSASNRKTWTWSGWIKRGKLGVLQGIASAPNGSTEDSLAFLSGDTLRFYGNGQASGLTTAALFRDPSAWYHIVLAMDTTQATASNRTKLYVNGVQQSFTGSDYLAQNTDTMFNANVVQYIGYYANNASNCFDGHITEVNFIDGQALTPTSFAEQDITTRMWVPKKYTGTYGTNGFYLNFSDITSTTTLGYDKSGNGNNWTANNISLTSGVTYDSMLDVPGLPWADGGNGRGNYATLSPLEAVSANLYDANTRVTFTATSSKVVGTQYADITTDSRYFEVTTLTGASANGILGIATNASGTAYNASGTVSITSDGTVRVNGSTVGTYSAWSDGQTIGIYFGSGNLYYSVNGTAANSGNPVATGLSGSYTLALWRQSSSATPEFIANFGQRPFAFTPPTGFKALNTANLPDPTGAAAKPWEHFDVVLATGANIKTTAEAVFPSNYLEWIKDRANANNNQLIDIVRGSSAVLQSNTTAAETTYSAPSGSSVAWVWKAGGAAVSNTAGSITSQVSANTAAGVSVVTYTGALTGAGTSTIGHGLGIAPKMIISKSRNVAGSEGGSWFVQHSALGANKFLQLNSTSATQDSVATGGGSLPVPTSSVFSATWNSGSGVSGNNYIAYCFAEVPSFSRFGSYTGNGSADGPFVFCGFRPRYVMVKRTDAAGEGWMIIDAVRDTYNVSGQFLRAELADAEVDGRPRLDFLSNGFKVKVSGASTPNTSGATYVFAAFSESPMKFSNAR